MLTPANVQMIATVLACIASLLSIISVILNRTRLSLQWATRKALIARVINLEGLNVQLRLQIANYLTREEAEALEARVDKQDTALKVVRLRQVAIYRAVKAWQAWAQVLEGIIEKAGLTVPPGRPPEISDQEDAL
jgi:hypothetical protein